MIYIWSDWRDMLILTCLHIYTLLNPSRTKLSTSIDVCNNIQLYAEPKRVMGSWPVKDCSQTAVCQADAWQVFRLMRDPVCQAYARHVFRLSVTCLLASGVAYLSGLCVACLEADVWFGLPHNGRHDSYPRK